MKKVLSSVFVLSMLVGCNTNPTAEPTVDSTVEATATAESSTVDGEKFLQELQGSYVNLFSTILTENTQQQWIDDTKAVLGEEADEGTVNDTVAMLQGSVTGSVTGEEAVTTYASNPEAMSFNCDFTNDVFSFTFAGNMISGMDESGNTVFEHEYEYVGYDEATGFYEFQSLDGDSGEFSYFVMWPDTPATTYHIEFRYGSNLDDLLNMYEGQYAYWMAAGIQTDADETVIANCINLFVTENLVAE